jgi:hypothetical protein
MTNETTCHFVHTWLPRVMVNKISEHKWEYEKN